MAFKSTAISRILNLFDDYAKTDFFTDLLENGNLKSSSYLVDLLNSSSNVLKFYSARILNLVIRSRVEQLTLKEFESLNFTKTFKSPLLLAVTLLSSKQYLTAPNLDRVRNQAGASLVGLRRSSDFLGTGLENLILLNLFMDLDLDFEVPQSFQLIPPQRFTMILNSLGGWMDSDLAYEDEFVPARICLMEFVEKYIKGVYYVCDTNYPADFILKVFELGFRVVCDSLSLVNSGETHLSLAYVALKLLNLLNEYKDNIDSWNESIDDVYNDVIELFIKQAEVPPVSQPIKLVNQILCRVITRAIPPNRIKDQYENLYKFVGSRSFDIQRTVVSLLRSFIPEIQDALVVEATLSKPSVEGDGADNDCKLPSILIDNIKTIDFEDYLENEDHAQVYSYLWRSEWKEAGCF
ncbi:unnamed protein product [Ambrosiozyma monospora]|uniref:Unnamed protein product n=1 Tax=Ambrosiozyma monospora TaxID=43982 RepID=A0ACB5TAU9_AMBMO|nr:unnamed protein product [Ambrosiozyma monospora]